MAIRFRDYQQHLAPRWLRGTNGSMWLSALGNAKDHLEHGLRSAIYQKFPSFASWDSLNKLGGERQLDRGVVETEAQYRARIASAWDIWPKAGTPEGILTALNLAGYEFVYLVCANGEYWTRNAGTGALTINVSATKFSFSKNWWNEFRVFFLPTFPAWWSPIPANDSDEVNNIRRIVNLWKPARAKLDGFTLVQGPLWGWPVSQKWNGASLTWGGTASTQWTAE